ncbi:MAG: serine/threonine protein kinase, partial [Myxococcales bacterium]|nr:serine/threonine protein kinase [Myxococcales bacterium]
MTSQNAPRERAARAFAIFKAVVELPADARGAAIATACDGDEALSAEVDELLALDAIEDGLMDATPGAGRQVIAHDLLMSMLAGGELTPVAHEPPPDAIGPYRIVGVLGAGGMGVVYEAEQAHPRRRVAIKTVHPWLRSPALAARFDFEVQALASLRHRAIPRLYEVREEAGATWMVMELVRGERITDYAAALPIDARLGLLREVVAAVQHAHGAGIGHRDLKPSNVIVCDGEPRILDFGLAAPLDGSDAAFAAIGGTVAYMAPEQLVPGAVVDHRADIYALGVLAYELLTGTLPVALADVSLAAARQAKRMGLVTPASTLVAGVRDDLDHIIARAMAPDPDARYATAAELGADLARYEASRPVAARPPTLVYRARTAARRHATLLRAVGATLAAVLVAAAVVLGVRAWEAGREADAREARPQARLTALEGRLEALIAAGERAQADALFDVFARMQENVGTKALFEAWIRRAERQAGLGRDDAAVDAYAGAYAAAASDADRARALVDLGVAFARRGAWGRADRVLDRIAELGGDADPRATSLRAEVLAFRRDFAGALAAEPATLMAPILRQLERATPLELLATSAWGTDVGGRPAVVVLDQPARELLVLRMAPRPAQLARLPLPDRIAVGASLPRALGGTSDLVLARHDDATIAYLRLLKAPIALEEVVGPRLEHVWSGAGWLRADGGVGVAVGSAGLARQFAVGVLGSEAARLATEAEVGVASDCDGVVAADFDGDGRVELIAAFGAWSSYEVRALRPGDDGSVELLGAQRVGSMTNAVLMRSADGPIAVLAKADQYPNPELLGEAHPFGEPAGLYLFALREGALRELARLRFPAWIREGGASSLV